MKHTEMGRFVAGLSLHDRMDERLHKGEREGKAHTEGGRTRELGEGCVQIDSRELPGLME